MNRPQTNEKSKNASEIKMRERGDKIDIRIVEPRWTLGGSYMYMCMYMCMYNRALRKVVLRSYHGTTLVQL